MWDWRFVILICKYFPFNISLLIGMAFQLILASRSGNAPLRMEEREGKGSKEGERWARKWVSDGSCGHVYMANRMRNATIRQKRPIASDRAKPRMA